MKEIQVLSLCPKCGAEILTKLTLTAENEILPPSIKRLVKERIKERIIEYLEHAKVHGMTETDITHKFGAGKRSSWGIAMIELLRSDIVKQHTKKIGKRGQETTFYYLRKYFPHSVDEFLIETIETPADAPE